MSKYGRLAEYLRSLSANEWIASFAEIEKLLGFPLPTSARSYPAWWANQVPPFSQTRGWADAGWDTAHLNLGRERVTFVRRSGVRPAGRVLAPAATQLHNERSVPRPSRAETPHGWDSADKVVVGVGFTWRPLGRVVLDEQQRLVFPRAPTGPGLYRFTILKGGKLARYIGESDNIERRFMNYRNPGTTQPTNVRLNERLLADLAAGAEIAVAIATEGFHLNRGDGSETPDLRVKSVRLLIESAALQSGGAEEIESLNRTT
jgi:hypothetical protein